MLSISNYIIRLHIVLYILVNYYLYQNLFELWLSNKFIIISIIITTLAQINYLNINMKYNSFKIDMIIYENIKIKIMT